MNRAVPIPVRPEDLTSAWLNAALHSDAADTSGCIAAVDVEPIGVGVGLVGGLYRCTLTYDSNSGDLPSSVVVKIRSEDPKSLRVAKLFQLYEKEVAFYRDIASHTPMTVPVTYYCDFDPKSHDFVLVLEDLQHLDVHSQLVGATPEQGKLAIREVAKLHSHFWSKVQQPPLDTYFSLVKPSITLKIHIGFHNSVNKVLEIFDAELSPVAKNLIRTFGDTLAGHYREMAKGPLTLNHGDYRLDNMFFGDVSNDELTVIDWQTNGIGTGLTDVAYFMAGSMAPNVRREIERDAIAEYHEVTCKNGGAQWSQEACWQAYRQNFVAAMTVPVIAAGELSLDNERAFELVQIGIQRMNSAIEDLDVEEFSPKRRSIFSVAGLQSRVGNQLARLAPSS